MENWQIRKAVPDDIPSILQMVEDLAVYEKESPSVVELTEQEMLRDGFGNKPWFYCLIAETLQDMEGASCSPCIKAFGYAFYFYTYSTWQGRTLFLEDLYIDPAFRGKGIGKTMLKKVTEIAVENGCVRVDWHVLHWNKLARDFYDTIGAQCLGDWRLYRLKGESLLEFSGTRRPAQSS